MSSEPFEAGESDNKDYEETVKGSRKTRDKFTRRVIELFRGFQGKNYSFKEISNILNISIFHVENCIRDIQQGNSKTYLIISQLVKKIWHIKKKFFRKEFNCLPIFL